MHFVILPRYACVRVQELQKIHRESVLSFNLIFHKLYKVPSDVLDTCGYMHFCMCVHTLHIYMHQ